MFKLFNLFLSPDGSGGKAKDEPLISPDDEEGEDVNEDGKDSEGDDEPEDATNEDEVEDESGDDESDDDPDTKDPKSTKKTEDVPFTQAQQAKINELVKTRLERADIKRERELMDAAGTEVAHQETFDAMRLWGFLKLNPDLSREVEKTMATFVDKGNFRQPEYKQGVSKEQLLEVKEEMINLREKDSTFAKHSTDIMEWADSKGFAVTDKDSLHLAYLAWKGERGNVVRATEQLREQRNQAKKTEVKKKAKLAGGKSSTKKKPVGDYSKLSDKEVLEAEGLSLFTDDD